jgi:glucokinase
VAAPGIVSLAVDIGGTKMAAGLVDDAGDLVSHHQVPTPPHGDAEELFAALASVIALVEGRDEADVCGVGCGGPMTGFGDGVSPINIGGWRDFPLRERLERHVGLPTFVDNDAKALALAEGWKGAAVDCDDYLALVVSTGVGGGLVLGGELVDGRVGNAGHLGHVIVEPEGRACACGAHGCLEAEASGTAIRAITGASPAEAGPDVRARTGRLVGLAVASVANLLDLKFAVVAGSVALGYGAAFFDAAQAELDRSACLDFSRGAVIQPAGLGAEGPLVGAAAVGRRGLARRGGR